MQALTTHLKACLPTYQLGVRCLGYMYQQQYGTHMANSKLQPGLLYTYMLYTLCTQHAPNTSLCKQLMSRL